MTFGAPLLLLALLAVPAALLAMRWWRRRVPPPALPFPDLDLIAAAAPPPRRRRHLPLALAVLALAGFCVALARPEAWRDQPREQATIMLAIDVSGSMAATDVEPFRLRAAQDAAKAFAAEVPRQYKIGLVSFSGAARLLVPPTTDRRQLERAIDGLLPHGATAIGDAVQAALAAIRAVQAPEDGRPAAARILLISDGASTQGVLTTVAAGEAKRAGVPVYTVALGTEDGILYTGQPVPPEPEALAALAEETDGQAFESRDAAAVSAVYERLGSFIGTERARSEVTGWVAGIAALLLALAGLAAWRLGPRAA
jgi:Ca-activated chloride channel family protein